MRLFIDRETWRKWQYWADLSKPHEVSALGKVELIESEKSDPYLVVRGLVLPDQLVSGSRSAISAEGAGWAAYKLRDLPGMLWWVHSHVDMKAFWSATDHAGLRELCEENDGLACATVTNLRGEHLSCLAHQIGALHHLQEIELSIFDYKLGCEGELEARFKEAVKPFPKEPARVTSMLDRADPDELAQWGHWIHRMGSDDEGSGVVSDAPDVIRAISREIKRGYQISKRQRREIMRDVQENLALGLDADLVLTEAREQAHLAEMEQRTATSAHGAEWSAE